MARFVDSFDEFRTFNADHARVQALVARCARRARRLRITAETTPGLGSKAADVGSAHPADQRFDPEQAVGAIGPLAETIRKYMSDKLKCNPPGLQTQTFANGLRQVVIADNSNVGIGLKVTVELLHPPGDPSGGTVPPPGNVSPPGGAPLPGTVPPPAVPGDGTVPGAPGVPANGAPPVV